jgi:5-methyltetrahydrofolate--homocysteine methyltransferase
MVSCDKILDAVRKHNADILGLSGLITPSLDEMIHNAKEMTKDGMKIPLLVGGATTSRAHTAIKIAPFYNDPVVQVPDASLVVNVCNDLTNIEKKKTFIEKLKTEQKKEREKHAGKSKQKLLGIQDARKKSLTFNWDSQEIAKPQIEELGVQKISAKLNEVIDFFDWSPFFWSWELKGQYPSIFDRSDSGNEAKDLFENAQKILKRIIDEELFTCEAVIGLWPANSDADDVVIYEDWENKKELARFHFIRRQQTLLDQPQYCLSDYIAPVDSNRTDYLGAFAVCAGTGVDSLAKEFEEDNDDYNAIMTKALGDRFAEAMAEYCHKKVRGIWGFGEGENLTNLELIKEKYRGIRPASGYPCQPDHTEKDIIWKVLDVKKTIGLELTESRAMNPGCSVSGLYFSHPEAKYFNVGKLDKDQVEDYAKRKNWSFEEAVKWLRPNLGFDS